MRNRFSKIAFLLVTTIIGGCAGTPEHTNTLMFATTTKFALDVSVSPTGGTPDFTLGYKRSEGVWMPLLANKETGETTKPADCDKAKSDCLFQGKEEKGKKTDTYSVLASFGAKFSGGASSGATDSSSPNAQASGGLAQFFATGIAAQNLASQGGSRLVSIQPVDKKLLEAAEKRANKAEEQEEQLKKILGEEYEKKKNIGLEGAKGLGAKKLLIIQTIAPSDKYDEEKWRELVDATDLDDKETKKAWDLKKIKTKLELDQAKRGNLINSLYEKI